MRARFVWERILLRRCLDVVSRCVVLARLDVLKCHIAENSCCDPPRPARSSMFQGDVHRVVLTCAQCMGLLRTGLLRRRCAAVCYCSPRPPPEMLSKFGMAGWQRTRCRNVNFCQAYLQSAVWTYARCPSLVHRSCSAVCCRLSSAVSAGSSRLPRWFTEVPMSDRYSASRRMSVMLS